MLEYRAYAKINLGLRILRARTDGYHDIETVLHRIDLFDEITFEESDVISLNCNNSSVPTDDHNLCVRAAIALQQFCDIRAGVHMRLRKQIPVGAGLGGGSSDAATTLKALNRFWRLDLSPEELSTLALQLGSDVPYFLNNGTAYATGRGEVLEYFTLDVPYSIVVVHPQIHIPTPWAYQNIHLEQLTRRPPLTFTLKQIIIDHIADPRRLTMHLGNDFEPLLLRTHAAIAQLKQALLAFGADLVLLSGSGSSVFALFSKNQHAEAAVIQLGKSYPVFITAPHFQPEG